MARPSVPQPNAADPVVVGVARKWLILLAVLLVAPWLVIGGIYVRGDSPPAEPEGQPAGLSHRPQMGPWGQLTLTPIVISPPLEYVPAEWGRNEPARWAFPGVSPEEVRAFLSGTGAAPDQVAQLQQAVRSDPAIKGAVVIPPPAVVLALSPEVRATIYTMLARSALNFDQAQSFRFPGTTPDDWFRGSLMSPKTRALISPLAYRDGPFLHFADIESIRHEVGSPEELQRLAKTLLRNATVLVELSVTQASEVSDLANYWGIGGRRTDIRPLLESLAAHKTRSIDIVHLLPAFARDHLYRYPKITTEDLNRPLLANCLWSSLNFFRGTPDDRFLDVDIALATLRKDYYVVEHGYQLGDLVALVDQEGNLFHVAVYLAADLVFTKNGTSPVSPWTIMPLPELVAYYKGRAETPRLIYHRQNIY